MSESDSTARGPAGRDGYELVRFVLVETSHPGNIGAAARAMKTMGFRDLWLVQPAHFPSADASARASGADDLLHEARVCTDLSEALRGCRYAFATTARPRELGQLELPPRAAAARTAGLVAEGPVAVVFGRERYGLSNAELDLCQALVRIPTSPSYASLNLGAAVQLLAYELRVAMETGPEVAPPRGDRVGVDDLEGLYAHLERALTTIGYYDPANPKKLMRRLRRMFARLEMDAPELRIVRGILTAAERAACKRD